MKRILSIIVIFILVFLTSCATTSERQVKKNDLELNIMSWEDYIYDEEPSSTTPAMVKRFKEYYKEKYGKNITVNYSTQGTNELMYSELNMNSGKYDLVNPSEYMIQKMIKEDMLEPLDRTNYNVDVYDENVSPYIANLFKTITIDDKNLYDYACCYMWGTMGFVYNPEMVDSEDIKHWSVVWNEQYKNKATIKDSVRDSYILALGYVYQDELLNYATMLENNEITIDEYNDKLTEIFNSVSNDAINKTDDALTQLSKLIYGYEVDSGKKEMAQGKIWINFAWSGDAVYAMDFAEDEEEVGDNTAELYYEVPVEGSNIFFDAWVMPKGANVQLAQEFINFVQTPENAIDNMDYIGYTTSIATTEVFDYIIDTYECYTVDDVSKEDDCFYVYDEEEKIEVFPIDLNYLFNGDEESDFTIYTDCIGRQLSAQYPTLDVVSRCTVMKHLNDDELSILNQMWEDAKEGNSDLTIMLIAVIVIILTLLILYATYKLIDKGLIVKPVKKGYYRKK